MPNRSVLVVEDNPVLAESITFALTTFGWRVVGPFGSNAAALPDANAGGFSTAVLDFDLGSESSIPIATVLRAKGVPFIFLTGHDAATQLPGDFAGEICLLKPVTPEKLVRVLESSIGTRGRRSPG